jgi:hypothetical protein
MNCENIDRNIQPFYRAVILEIERRRLALHLSMQELCDRAGVADYYWSKAVHANTPSGREARWSTLQDIVDAIYPAGYDVCITPKAGMRLDAKQLRCKIKFAAAAVNPVSQRELMRTLSQKGVEARRAKLAAMTEEQRKRAIKHIVKKAKKTRRKNRKLRLQQAAIPRKPKQRRTAVEPCVATITSAGPCCALGAPPAST